MPEFFTPSYRYQKAAQPYLEGIARGVRDSAEARAFLLWGTEHAVAYLNGEPMWAEQWQKRDPNNALKCAFWSNYWYEPCSTCDCRIEASVSMEIDAIFVLRNPSGNRLAIHVEMKRDREALSLGQAEAYRPRAKCYRDQRRQRPTMLWHDHFVTVLFCGHGTDLEFAKRHFDRVILHSEARQVLSYYPQT